MLKIAGSRLESQHTEETLAKMSKAQSSIDKAGVNNPMYNKTGEDHPIYGKLILLSLKL